MYFSPIINERTETVNYWKSQFQEKKEFPAVTDNVVGYAEKSEKHGKKTCILKRFVLL